MSNKPEYSKKILKILAEKPALATSLMTHIGPQNALKRSLKTLIDTKLVESHHSGQNEYLRLTRSGRAKASSQKLDASSSLLNPLWDGKWRVVILDLPESRKDEREALRYLLKKAGFVCLKNSVWISPFPYEYLFANIKKDFGLTFEMMIIVTDKVDELTEKYLIEELTVSR